MIPCHSHVYKIILKKSLIFSKIKEKQKSKLSSSPPQVALSIWVGNRGFWRPMFLSSPTKYFFSPSPYTHKSTSTWGTKRDKESVRKQPYVHIPTSTRKDCWLSPWCRTWGCVRYTILGYGEAAKWILRLLARSGTAQNGGFTEAQLLDLRVCTWTWNMENEMIFALPFSRLHSSLCF